MLTTIVMKIRLAKMKYFTRRERKAIEKKDFNKAVKYGKLVGREFDKLFGY